MKTPLRIKEVLYHDNQTGKPVGSEYWIFDDAAEELFVINDDEDAARRIVACVNACAGISTEMLELAGADFWEKTDGNFEALIAENAQLREQNKQLATALSDAMKALIQP